MAGKCETCGAQVGVLNLKNGTCKSCLNESGEAVKNTNSNAIVDNDFFSKFVTAFGMFIFLAIGFLCLVKMGDGIRDVRSFTVVTSYGSLALLGLLIATTGKILGKIKR